MTKGPSRSADIPDRIIASKLPTRVYWKGDGLGRWMIKYKDEAACRWKARRLCGPEATLSEIWQAYEALSVPAGVNFATISRDFQQTPIWRRLAVSTQRDYLDCHNSICARKTSIGLLGELELIKWTIGLVRKYRDARGEESASRANKELAYIKRIFSWAYEYEKIKTNPTLGIKKLLVKARQHYAEDEDYQFMLKIAAASPYWYAPVCMEIAYLCRMRLSEVLDMTDANELSTGLLIKRRKGSRNNITAWNDRLKTAWQTAITTRNHILSQRKQPHPFRPEDRFVFISERTGDLIQVSSLKTAIGRITNTAQAEADRLGIQWTRFTFHDLKRKGVSDTPGNKQDASGHRNASMLNIYDVKLKTVEPSSG